VLLHRRRAFDDDGMTRLMLDAWFVEARGGHVVFYTSMDSAEQSGYTARNARRPNA
jgi:hypothetical protein